MLHGERISWKRKAIRGDHRHLIWCWSLGQAQLHQWSWNREALGLYQLRGCLYTKHRIRARADKRVPEVRSRSMKVVEMEGAYVKGLGQDTSSFWSEATVLIS
jgi:hypothetical protein